MTAQSHTSPWCSLLGPQAVRCTPPGCQRRPAAHPRQQRRHASGQRATAAPGRRCTRTRALGCRQQDCGTAVPWCITSHGDSSHSCPSSRRQAAYADHRHTAGARCVGCFPHRPGRPAAGTSECSAERQQHRQRSTESCGHAGDGSQHWRR